MIIWGVVFYCVMKSRVFLVFSAHFIVGNFSVAFCEKAFREFFVG